LMLNLATSGAANSRMKSFADERSPSSIPTTSASRRSDLRSERRASASRAVAAAEVRVPSGGAMVPTVRRPHRIATTQRNGLRAGGRACSLPSSACALVRGSHALHGRRARANAGSRGNLPAPQRARTGRRMHACRCLGALADEYAYEQRRTGREYSVGRPAALPGNWCFGLEALVGGLPPPSPGLVRHVRQLYSCSSHGGVRCRSSVQVSVAGCGGVSVGCCPLHETASGACLANLSPSSTAARQPAHMVEGAPPPHTRPALPTAREPRPSVGPTGPALRRPAPAHCP
jgi:hypothetical protein